MKSSLLALFMLVGTSSLAAADSASLSAPVPAFDRQLSTNRATLTFTGDAPRAAGHFEILYDPTEVEPVSVEFASGLGAGLRLAWSAIGDGVARVVINDAELTGVGLPQGPVDLLHIGFDVVEADFYLETAIRVRGGATAAAAADSSLIPIAEGPWIEIDLLDSQLTDAPSAPAQRLALYQSQPNPFNPQTEIRFETPSDGRASVRIYDVAGRLVRKLVDEELAAGTHVRTWNGADDRGQRVSSGVYLYRLEFGRQSATKKLSLVK